MWLSKSKIFDYQWCARRFEYKYIDKIPPEVEPPAQTIGRNFHTFFELFFDEVKIKDGMNAIECTDEIRRAAKYVSAPMSGDLESYIDFAQTSAEDYYKIIQTFVDAEAARATMLSPHLLTDYYYPVEAEKTFQINDLKFRGIIDRIDLDPDLKYTVMDYKTGNVTKEVSKIRKELCFYAMGAKECGYEITYGVMFFPRAGHVFLEKIKPISLTYARKTIESVRQDIEDGKFPCRVGHWCQHCPYFSICDFGGEPPLPERKKK